MNWRSRKNAPVKDNSSLIGEHPNLAAVIDVACQSRTYSVWLDDGRTVEGLFCTTGGCWRAYWTWS